MPPDCRAPSRSPRPRSSRSSSAILKPSSVCVNARSRSGTSIRRGEQDAVRFLLAAPHPAPQLMQLRQAEALGMLDHHHRGVRHVDADLDHRRRHQHLHLAVAERAHHPVALRRLEPAVHQPDAHVGPLRRERRRPSSRRRAGRRAPIPRSPGSTTYAWPPSQRSRRARTRRRGCDAPACAAPSAPTPRPGGLRLAGPTRRDRRSASAPAIAESASPSAAARPARRPCASVPRAAPRRSDAVRRSPRGRASGTPPAPAPARGCRSPAAWCHRAGARCAARLSAAPSRPSSSSGTRPSGASSLDSVG